LLAIQKGYFIKKNTEIIKINIFNNTLKWVIDNQYQGGCHFISVIMYILLQESKIKCNLCIGEVKTGNNYFDHSWIEIDNKVYDVAIVMPLPGGIRHNPVFNSIDIENDMFTSLGYGLISGEGFNDDATQIADLTLKEYASHQGEMLWELTKIIGKSRDIKINIGKIKETYGMTKRKLIQKNI
jgi:hypothetical protein